MTRCKCGRATLSHINTHYTECSRCHTKRIVREQDKHNELAREASNTGKIQDSLLFAGIHIDT